MNFLRVVGLVLFMLWLVLGPLVPEDVGDPNCCCASPEATSQMAASCNCEHASCQPPGAAQETHALVHRGRSVTARRMLWLIVLGLLLVWKWLWRLQSRSRPGPWSRQRRPGPLPELLHFLLNLPPPSILL